MHHPNKDPTLKAQLTSRPSCAAFLELIWGHARKYSRAMCIDVVDSYASEAVDGGLTERTVRVACGLPPTKPLEVAPVVSVATVEEKDGLAVTSDLIIRWLVAKEKDLGPTFP